MSLKPQALAEVPEETVRVARAAFPKGNLYAQQPADEDGSLSSPFFICCPLYEIIPTWHNSFTQLNSWACPSTVWSSRLW
jgi:transposase